MRARFKGDPNRNGEGPEVIEAFGLTFTKGAWIGVDGLDPVFLRKLRGNNHFEMDAGKVAAAVAPAAPAEPDAIPADWQKAHHSTRMKWAAQIKGERPASTAEADEILTKHMAPKAAPTPTIVDPPAKGDDDWGDLDPEV
jgi:hypothetical protein